MSHLRLLPVAIARHVNERRAADKEQRPVWCACASVGDVCHFSRHVLRLSHNRRARRHDLLRVQLRRDKVGEARVILSRRLILEYGSWSRRESYRILVMWITVVDLAAKATVF